MKNQKRTNNMLGIKSSGCFIIGILTGFILAFFAGIVCICYFNPDIKHKTVTRVEEIWKSIKSGVDGSIDAAKNAPTVEPQVSLPPSSPTVKNAAKTLKKERDAAVPPQSRPRIEIKLGI